MPEPNDEPKDLLDAELFRLADENARLTRQLTALRAQHASLIEQTPNMMVYGPGVEDFTRAMIEEALSSIKQELAARIRAGEGETTMTQEQDEGREGVRQSFGVDQSTNPIPARGTLATLEAWTREIARCWPMDRATYPALDGLDIEYIRHIVLHVSKDSGRLSAAVEPADHQRQPDFALLERATRNMLVNSLRLCELMGWRADTLLRHYVEEVTTQPPSASGEEAHERAKDSR